MDTVEMVRKENADIGELIQEIVVLPVHVAKGMEKDSWNERRWLTTSTATPAAGRSRPRTRLRST
jgi:hypothetical protein